MAAVNTRSNPAHRIKLLLENYVEAKKAGPNSGYDISPINPDSYEEYYILIQPKHGVYKGHSYVLELKTTYGRGSDQSQYPIEPPYAHFVTNVFHTNISSNGGSICVDILKQKDKWMPTYSFDAIVQNILLLFDEPNNASPYNGEASRCWVDCEKNYNSSKHRNMSVQQLEELHNQCFELFSQKANDFARSNNMLQYKKHFPQLFPKAADYNSLQQKVNDEFTEVEAMYESMKKKKTKTAVTESKSSDKHTSLNQSNTETNKANTETNKSNTLDKSMENLSISEEDSTKKVEKKNRWAKYQKK
jgi:hypothetical protein